MRRVKKWTRRVGRGLHLAAAVTEEAVDAGRRAVTARLGRNQPSHIATYGGYTDRSGTHLAGRILASSPGGGPTQDDSLWDNLVGTMRRVNSDEVAGVEVEVRFNGHETTVISDEEGYYHATLPAVPGNGGLWATAHATVRAGDREISATHDVLTPSPTAAFGIISDLDDTVIHTGITSLWLTAKLTFLGNAKTRKPLDGVSELYAALQKGTATTPVNPVFYVSSSPWNLYDLLLDFINLNEIPRGPLMLRDWGLDRTKFIAEKGHGHKLEKALKILDGYPELPFVLIGDSGQEDPAIYAQVCELRPGRVRAIYIRDVDPDHASERDALVHHALEIAGSLGVPMILAPDSQAMSEHASHIGLIPATAVFGVIEEIHKDEQLPGAGEQAIKDAANSVLP